MLPECNMIPCRPKWPMMEREELCERTGISGLGVNCGLPAVLAVSKKAKA